MQNSIFSFVITGETLSVYMHYEICMKYAKLPFMSVKYLCLLLYNGRTEKLIKMV